MTATKTDSGNFFEDFSLGMVMRHATPRTVTEGDRALYQALYPMRFALQSSDVFAQDCGYEEAPLDDLAAFHIVFGKTVPDISLNAVANLGYAEGRFLCAVHVGDTLNSVSEVIGVKENSNGKTGVVWVRTSGTNQVGEVALEYVRWVMVRKRDAANPAPEPVVPNLTDAVAASDLVLPESLDFGEYDTDLAGAPHLWDDYDVGEKIDHVDGVTLEEAEHMLATRLWQNTAKVHFSTMVRPEGRLIYGGHIISLARALSFNGLANAQLIVAINGGAHAAPSMAGDTIHAWSEVLDKSETSDPNVGALRLRLVAVKNRTAEDFPLKGADGRYAEGVVLDFDYWVLMPRRG
ncbi:MAG: MaoC family dehydratase [Paracoccaceae bacterium]